jgi:carbamoyl-phosphate synthase small subunit
MSILRLSNGRIFKGIQFGAKKSCFGEIVFTTSLTGYPESMTDPSYYNQILLFTQPLIGNYGIPNKELDSFGLLKNFESNKIHLKGIIVGNYSNNYSHWNSVMSLSKWCKNEDIPIISGIDTREITHQLRKSELHGFIENDSKITEKNTIIQEYMLNNVSTKNIYTVNKGGFPKISILDCGIKNSIIKCLVEKNAQITVYPWYTDLSKISSDGYVLSNGPGDPRKYTTIINNIIKLIKIDKPIIGICLGHQLLGLSIGTTVYKMKYGNRGHNQPIIDINSNKCYITSQNHGYAIDSSFLPKNWKQTFININDKSCEGISTKCGLINGYQWHPEANGGPNDTIFLFDKFLNKCKI